MLLPINVLCALYTECTNNGLHCGEDYYQNLDWRMGIPNPPIVTFQKMIYELALQSSLCEEFLHFVSCFSWWEVCSVVYFVWWKIFVCSGISINSFFCLYIVIILTPTILYSANGVSKFSTTDISVIDSGVDDKEDEVSHLVFLL